MSRWERREKKVNSKKATMPKHGRSLFTLEQVVLKRAEKAKTKHKPGNTNSRFFFFKVVLLTLKQ